MHPKVQMTLLNGLSDSSLKSGQPSATITYAQISRLAASLMAVGKTRWRASGYFATKIALIRASRTFCGPVARKAVATLSALPEHFVLEALK